MALAERLALWRRLKVTEGSRVERRAATARRRSMAILAGSVVAAAVILVAWFPAGALLAQQRNIAQASSTLTQLRAEDQALATESQKLSTPSEIARIARQQFGMVPPGESAYQVLPPPGTAGRYRGDPGNAGVASPSASAELPPGSLANSKSATAGRAGSSTGSSGPGILGRVIRTLEFWR